MSDDESIREQEWACMHVWVHSCASVCVCGSVSMNAERDTSAFSTGARVNGRIFFSACAGNVRVKTKMCGIIQNQARNRATFFDEGTEKERNKGEEAANAHWPWARHG